MRLLPALILATSIPAHAMAEPNCRNWMEAEFWESSTASDVRKCLDEGADVMARESRRREVSLFCHIY